MTLPDGFLERLAAAAAQEGLLDAAYSTFDSPLGRLLVAQSPLGVCAVSYLDTQFEDSALAAIAERIGPRIVRSRDETREVLMDAPPDGTDPQQADDAFDALIADLPDGTRAALTLRFVEDLEYDEIATRLECSPEAARQRVSTAIRTLRARMT